MTGSVIEYKPTKEQFAVECKFRNGLFPSTKINDYVLKWSYPEQIQRYNEFSKAKRIPVFILVGLGGKPSSPKYCFCIPLAEAKYPELFPSVLEKHERFPKDRTFYWRNGVLK